MWESLAGPRVRIRLNMWCQRQSNREADIPKRPHFSWTRTCLKCRKKTSATKDLCLSLSHLHFFPVSTNNLPSDDTEGRGETEHLNSFCSQCFVTHQSVEGRVWVEGAGVIKKMKTLLLIVCSVSTFSGTNGTYLYRSCKIKVVGFQWFPIIISYAYICIWNWHCIIYYIPMKGEVPDNNLHFSSFLEQY